MRRKSQYSQGAVSTVSMRRSLFDLSHGVKTSLSVGDLVPVDVQEVLPGDTFNCHDTYVARLSSSYLRPVMDNVWLDRYTFFVPLRLLYDQAEDVFGVSEPSEYIDSERAVFPSFPNSAVTSGSIADYMGLPVTSGSLRVPAGVSVLPFRAFALIYNEWFRNENVQQSVYVQKGERSNDEVLNSNPWSQNNYTGMPPKITKKKDYFTASLPAPQKGDPVTIGATVFPSMTLSSDNLRVDTSGTTPGLNAALYPFFVQTSAVDGQNRSLMFTSGTSVVPTPSRVRGLTTSVSATPLDASIVMPNRVTGNIVVPETPLTSVNVNDLRFAFQTQKMLEKDARFGTRYREYLLGHYGVNNADARMQVPEFISGSRIPLGMTTVAQTSAQDGNGTPLATLGGLSHSVGKGKYIKSFTEHGYLITCVAIRQLHTYQQGIEKMWFRHDREDFYDPLFANIGEQPVYTAQLYGLIDSSAALQPSLGNGDVLAYNEYGAEYRYRPSYITGQLRTGVLNSLDVYHFGDYYANPPTLSPDFINETSEYFDRTVAVPSSSQDNFILDIWFDLKAARVMPLYGDPGLIDHH